MSRHVDIAFDCVPLRSIARFDVPLDAAPELVAFSKRVRLAMAKHGVHNAYYLHRAACTFHLTNDEQLGTVTFRFEGAMLTDSADMKTIACDLDVELQAVVCDWLTADAVAWLAETVRQV